MMNGAWRIIAIALVTLVTGALGTWLSLGTDKVNRSDFEALRADIVELKVEQAKMEAEIELLLKKVEGR